MGVWNILDGMVRCEKYIKQGIQWFENDKIQVKVQGDGIVMHGIRVELEKLFNSRTHTRVV